MARLKQESLIAGSSGHCEKLVGQRASRLQSIST
jgi:hypothetical protein